MAKENKTQPTAGDPRAFLMQIEDERKREDALALLDMMAQVTGETPALWGNIIGFGHHHYKYASGREGDTFIVGFAPRKRNFTLYIGEGYTAYDDLMSKLGKHKTGVGCLYINKLADVDRDVLRELVQRSTERTRSLDDSDATGG